MSGVTLACFQASGNVAVVIEVLSRVVSSWLILWFPRLKMWRGHGSAGAPEWMDFMVEAISSGWRGGSRWSVCGSCQLQW